MSSRPPLISPNVRSGSLTTHMCFSFLCGKVFHLTLYNSARRMKRSDGGEHISIVLVIPFWILEALMMFTLGMDFFSQVVLFLRESV